MSDERLRGVDPYFDLKGAYKDYKVFDAHFENMGKVHDVFVDESDEVRYISIGSGLLNMDFIPIPVELVRLNDRRQVIEVDATKSQMTHAPTFSDSSELTRENEDGVRRHFGIVPILPLHTHANDRETTIPRDDARVDIVPGERDGTPPPSHRMHEFEGLPESAGEYAEIRLHRYSRNS